MMYATRKMTVFPDSDFKFGNHEDVCNADQETQLRTLHNTPYIYANLAYIHYILHNITTLPLRHVGQLSVTKRMCAPSKILLIQSE